MIGALGAELFLSRTAFLLSLIGMLLFLWGTRAVRVLAFPLFLLVFAVPLPLLVLTRSLCPQLLASHGAETLLSLLDIPVVREGNILNSPANA
jgi:hypothetical protein